MEIVFIVLSFICIALAGVAEAVMDKLQFHFDRSIFSNLKNKQWWNPIDSWKNKWKNGDKEQGEKFWLSSTILVWTTDAWHFFKSLRNFFVFSAVVSMNLVFNNSDLWVTLLVGTSLWTLYSAIFEFTFSKLLETRLP